MSIKSDAIPIRKLITDPNHMPLNYSETPGGTLYGTTPGGTKIVYERAFLLSLQQSPLSQTPPKLPIIHGCTVPKGTMSSSPRKVITKQTSLETKPLPVTHEDEHFAMDM